LYQKLRAEPWIQPWLDEEELYPGQDWNLEIEKAVKAADAIIVCLSKSSITKEGYVQKEIKTALDYADYKPDGVLYILPIRLEECKPPDRLSRWQYADYFGEHRGRAYQRLLTSLMAQAYSIAPAASLVDVSSVSKKDVILPKFFRRTIHLEYKINADAKTVNDFLLQRYAGVSFFIEIYNSVYQVDVVEAFVPDGKNIFQWGFVASGYMETARFGYTTVAGMKMTPDPIIEPISEMFLVSISQGQKGLSILNFDTDIKHAHMFTTGLVRELSKAFSVTLVHQPAALMESVSSKNNTQSQNVDRETYEKILDRAHKQVKPLAKIVVYCLYKYFCDELDVVFDTFDDKDKIREANQAVDSFYLLNSENGYTVNLYDPMISKVQDAVAELQEYLELIENNETNDLYEKLLSEYGFEPFISNKRYWEEYLYGKSLY